MSGAAGTDRRIDLPTVAAIAAVVGVVSTQWHEAVGHGGACLAQGLHLNAWSAFYVDCALEHAPPLAARLVEMAGSTMNLVAAIVGAIAFRATDPERFTARLSWWLFATVNAFDWAGYFLFSGVAGIGDWGTGQDGVLHGLPATTALIGRAVEAVGGMTLYVLLAKRAMAALAVMTGADADGLRDARRISLIAYATIGIVAILVGILNPQGIAVLLGSAAASSFGGLSGLWWGLNMLPRTGEGRGLVIARSRSWIAVAVALVLLEAILLGPTIVFA